MRPTVSHSPAGDASRGDLRPAKRRSGDPRRRNAERRGLKTLAERFKFATKAVGIRGRSRPTLQHATATLIIPDRAFYQCMQKMRRVAPRLRNPSTLIHNVFCVYGMLPEFRGFGG